MFPDLNWLEPVGAGLMGLGLVLGLAALMWLLAGNRGPVPAAPGVRPDLAPGLGRTGAIILFGLVAAALALRLWGLDARGITHPELYTPGIDLPRGLSEPPPRHGLLETMGYHFFWEPHPFGYYLAKWAWTKLAGTSLFSMRLPEAVIGAASVYLIFRVGALAYGPRTGLAAAVILTVHGFHIFWSQMARMYAPGAFLALAATWLLLEIVRRDRPSPVLEALYIGTFAAGALTVEFIWPILAMHMLWTALHVRDPDAAAPRLAILQAAAFILSSPMLAHAVMVARAGATDEATVSFITDYFTLGNLFSMEDAPGLPLHLALLAGAATAPLIALGFFTRPLEAVTGNPHAPPRPWPLVFCVLAAAVMIVGVALAAPARNVAVAAVTAVPVIVLAAPWIMGWIARFGLGERLGGAASICSLIAVVPPVLIWLASYRLGLAAERAYLLFIPFLVILAAAGLLRLWPRRALFAIAAAALGVVLAFGFVFQKQAPSSPRDYQGLAEALNREMMPGDLVYMPIGSWAYSPMFYYLDSDRVVAEPLARTLAKQPDARVWVIDFPDDPLDPEELAALAGSRRVRRVEVLNGSAVLYEPAP